MALHASTTYIKILKDPNGTPVDMTGKAIYDDISPTVTTESVSRTGIGGITKKRISAHSYSISISGDATAADFLIAALEPDNEFEIDVHDRAFKNAVIKSLGISCEDGDTLKISADFVAKTLEAITAISSMPDPGTFFVMSDAVVSFDGSSDTVTKFELNAERDITEVHGGSLDPTDFSKGSFKFTGTITISPSTSVGDLDLGARESSDTPFTFTATFKDDPVSPTTIIKLTASGIVATETSLDMSAENPIAIPVKFESTSLTIADTE